VTDWFEVQVSWLMSSLSDLAVSEANPETLVKYITWFAEPQLV
jgi:hypothetical protein